MAELIDIYGFSNYREFVSAKLKSMPMKGRGQIQQASKALGIHSSRLSRVLSGGDNLTPEQAFLLARYLGLNRFETDFFISLLDLERAGKAEYRTHLRERLRLLKRQATSEQKVAFADELLSDEACKVFFSNRINEVAWLSTMIPGLQSAKDLADALHLSLSDANKVVEFLTSVGLCVKEGEKVLPLRRYIHLEPESGDFTTKLRNWRTKAIETLDKSSKSDYFFTHTVAISDTSAKEVDQILRDAVQRIDIALRRAPATKVMCLNIDWFRATP